MLNWIKVWWIRRMLLHLNIVGFQLIYNTICFMDWSIVLLKQNILKTKRNHLIKDRKQMSSKKSDIPGFGNSPSNWYQRSLILASEATLYYKPHSFILLLWMNTILQPFFSRFSKSPLLSGVFRLLHTALITPNHSLKILSSPVLIHYSLFQSLCKVFWL